MDTGLDTLRERILACRKCPRLSEYTTEVARTKVRRFRDQPYHGGPVPGFGDVHARLLIVGLAPGAHGANRTGRMFTGDASGDWLMKVLHKHGFASIPTSNSADDGLLLYDTYIAAAARCAPPKNRPTAAELRNCLPYLSQEFEILQNIQIVLCLGLVAYQAVCKILNIPRGVFGHCILSHHNQLHILTSYHPSKQNTQTGRLTWNQWNDVFVCARSLLV